MRLRSKIAYAMLCTIISAIVLTGCGGGGGGTSSSNGESNNQSASSGMSTSEEYDDSISDNFDSTSSYPDAVDPNVIDWIYTVLTDGTAMITGYKNGPANGVLEIPEKVGPNDKYTVSCISGEGFQNDAKITSVSIPSTVKYIGNSVFSNCENLRSVYFSEGIESLGSEVFQGTSIKNLVLPKSMVSVGQYAFAHNSVLESVIVKGDTSFDYAVFQTCVKLTQIKFEGILECISDYMFDGCTSLEEIEIPVNVRDIGSYAFQNCTALKEISIPEEVGNIRLGTFKGCTSLESVTLPDDLGDISDAAFSGCKSLTSISLPNKITGIGNYGSTVYDGVFENCKSLRQIVLPESLLGMGYYMFDGCDLLETVYISGNIHYMECYFRDCPNLKTINFGGSEAAWNKQVSALPGADFSGITINFNVSRPIV